MKEVDISKHELVPQHIKLDDKEKIALLEQFNVGLSQLPKIRVKDKALGGMEVKPGDVIKIVRKSPTDKETVFYRVVIND
tara:strand:+ start:268 stop:507 length:240 start_codon:yes stop_codon:yes gene_type:complete